MLGIINSEHTRSCTDGRKMSYMQSFEVLEVVLLDLSNLVVLQIQQGGVVRDVPRNRLQTWWCIFFLTRQRLIRCGLYVGSWRTTAMNPLE